MNSFLFFGRQTQNCGNFNGKCAIPHLVCVSYVLDYCIKQGGFEDAELNRAIHSDYSYTTIDSSCHGNEIAQLSFSDSLYKYLQ